jgi:hypothetical protein
MLGRRALFISQAYAIPRGLKTGSISAGIREPDHPRTLGWRVYCQTILLAFTLQR